MNLPQLPGFLQNLIDNVRNLSILQGVPRIAYIAAVPVVIFVLGIAVVLAATGDEADDDGDAVQVANVPTASLENIDVEPTATRTPRPRPTTVPTATPEPALNREDCTEIQGTDYLSGEEREWYLGNCLGGNTANAGDGGGGDGGGAPAAPAGGGVQANCQYGYTGEAATGARLLIPQRGIDAPIYSAVVPCSGAMPDPVGYHHAVEYDFSNFSGLGGSNRNVAAHVDCASCNNGGPGTALFWDVRNMGVGETAQWITSDGQVENYVVTASYAVSPNIDWSGIVAAGAADMTLITCTGNFAAGDYDTRHVVAFARQ